MSRLPFELLLALRYLRPKRTFVSIITLISVMGVMLGVAVLIIVISVMSGFDSELREKILGFNAHLRIMQVDPSTGQPVTMTNYALVMSVVNSNQNVKGSTPFILGPVMVETERPSGSQQVAAPFLRGMDPQTADNVSLIISNIVAGSNDLSGHGLLVGTDFARNLGLHIGDRVAIYSPRDLEDMNAARKKGEELAITPRDFEVRGIFDAGWFEYNSSFIISSLDQAQNLYRIDDDVHGLLVMLKDPYQASLVQTQLELALGSNVIVTTWNEDNSAMSAVVVEKNVMLYILFFIVIVAAFGITCTLITFVVLKTRDIGVLKALGATGRQIMWIFLSQSMVVSVLGVLFGLGFGMLAVVYRNPFLHLMRRLTGFELFPAKIYMLTELPARIMPGDIAIICGGSFIICLLAAAFPAWHASRLKPVEALRHE